MAPRHARQATWLLLLFAAPAQALDTTSFSNAVTAAPYVGNGYLGARIPAAGEGFLAAQGIQTWPTFGERLTTSMVAGLYGTTASAFGVKSEAALVPDWTELTFGDSSGTYDANVDAGDVSGYRQSQSLRTGAVSTSGTWTAPSGNRTRFAYAVLADRAYEHRALVTLSLTPAWSGQLTVTSQLDGSAARRTDPGTATVAGHVATVASTTTGLGTPFAETAILAPPPGAASSPIELGATQTAGERVTLTVTAGRTYHFAKYVGVAGTAADAQREAHAAATAGTAAVTSESAEAWARLHRGAIVLPHNPALQRVVRAGEYALQASARSAGPTALGPSGLSSDSYAGAVFWDQDTWMFPALLAQHPELARGMADYRFDTLTGARTNAGILGAQGAFFPWTSTGSGTLADDCYGAVVAGGQLAGDENRSCTTELHLQGDIALAQWQYFRATGDRAWLAARGWPVLDGIARYWASKAQAGSGGAYSIRGVQPPDEYHFEVTNEAYTNAIAALSLRIATRAAKLVGQAAPATWATIAAGLERSIPFDAKHKIHPEYDGYAGDQVKQADVVMLTYPLEFRMPAAVARADLDYYAPRTAPAGPAMTDAIHSIDASALNVPGCSAWTYLLRSYEPYLRAPYDQFSETRPPDTVSAFEFLTGVGGFLQTFVYGFPGLRLERGGVRVDPSLPPQLPELTLRRVRWHGRVITLRLTRKRTRVTLVRGRPLPLLTPAGRRTLRGTVVLPTRRPDRLAGADLVRCRAATASSAVAGNPAIAAVDGSPATSWTPSGPGATLTVRLARVTTPHTVHVAGGTVPYTAETSLDGRSWTKVGTSRARYLRLRFSGDDTPSVTELTVG